MLFALPFPAIDPVAVAIGPITIKWYALAYIVGLLGGCRHAMRLFSHSRLRRMMLTGLRVPGAELYRLGIVEACTAPEDLMPTALEMAAVIASKSPVST